jgi:anti-sigma B factor antagonist
MNRRAEGVEPAIWSNEFRCVTQSMDGQAVVRVEGEIDLATAPSLQEALLDAIGNHASCVVADLAAVTFMDSTGIHIILNVNNAAMKQGTEFILRAPQPNVLRVINLVGLGDQLKVEA